MDLHKPTGRKGRIKYEHYLFEKQLLLLPLKDLVPTKRTGILNQICSIPCKMYTIIMDKWILYHHQIFLLS